MTSPPFCSETTANNRVINTSTEGLVQLQCCQWTINSTKNITIRLELFLVTNDLLILEVCLVMQKRDQKKWLYKRVLQSSLKGRARAIMYSPNCFHFNQFIFSFSKNSSRFVSSIRNKEITGFLHPHLGCHWYARGQFGRASVTAVTVPHRTCHYLEIPGQR